jgi:hypothetical protein
MFTFIFENVVKLIMIVLVWTYYSVELIVGLLMTIAMLPAIIFLYPFYWVHDTVSKRIKRELK